MDKSSMHASFSGFSEWAGVARPEGTLRRIVSSKGEERAGQPYEDNLFNSSGPQFFHLYNGTPCTLASPKALVPPLKQNLISPPIAAGTVHATRILE